jgi:hypothetical protein
MTRWSFFIAALALIACGRPPESADTTKQGSSEIANAEADTRTAGILRSSEARVRSGKRTAEVLVSPEMVQLYRVANPFEEEPDTFRKLTKSRALIAGYPVMSEIKLDRNSALTIGTLLLQPQTYVAPGQELTCLFRAGYVVRFHRGNSHVDAVICFSCGDVSVQPSADLQEKGFTDSFYGTAGGKKLYRTITELFPRNETRPAA